MTSPTPQSSADLLLSWLDCFEEDRDCAAWLAVLAGVARDSGLGGIKSAPGQPECEAWIDGAIYEMREQVNYSSEAQRSWYVAEAQTAFEGV